MTAIGIAGIIFGMILIFLSSNLTRVQGLGICSALMIVGGALVGIGGNPAKDMPNGSPAMVGIGIASMIFAAAIAIYKIIVAYGKVNKNLIWIIVAVVFVVAGLGIFFASNSGGTSSSTRTCESCHRTFDKSSDDAHSIARTNMCENCYGNFKWGMEATGRW